MEAFEVGIVGAGIHGASAAFHLAHRGVRCVVFERGTPAGGPTGRSSGICRAYYTNEFLARAARDSIEMLANFEEITGGGDAGLRRTGMLYLHPPEDVEQVEEVVARLDSLGIATELLSLEETAARHPVFDLSGIGVCAFERDAGYADPAGATAGLFGRAVELGAEARLGTTVTALEPPEGGGAVVVTAGGARTECERLLVAAGPWTRPLARHLGADLPLTVERHVVAVFRWGRAEPVPAHVDLAGDHYFRPEGDDLFVVGHLRPAPQANPDD
ncbi:MAG: FAD-binding oxidoreductase, partial [Actinobacteria bacterium]|nr:FAD-binding oxidoreductase [Actinomycetota bacterium]